MLSNGGVWASIDHCIFVIVRVAPTPPVLASPWPLDVHLLLYSISLAFGLWLTSCTLLSRVDSLATQGLVRRKPVIMFLHFIAAFGDSKHCVLQHHVSSFLSVMCTVIYWRYLRRKFLFIRHLFNKKYGQLNATLTFCHSGEWIVGIITKENTNVLLMSRF